MYGYRRHTTLLGVTLLGRGKKGVGEGGSNAAIYQYTLVFHATETEISFPPCML